MSEPEMGSAFALVALPSSKHDAKLLILFGIFGPGVQRKNTEFLFLPSIGRLGSVIRTRTRTKRCASLHRNTYAGAGSESEHKELAPFCPFWFETAAKEHLPSGIRPDNPAN